MHRPEKRRLLITATLWLAAISPLAAASPRPEASPPPPGSLYLYPERFALEDGSLAVGERGLLFVPVKRSDPQSGVLSVEVYRFSAKEGVPADAPPIFVLPGRPRLRGARASAGATRLLRAQQPAPNRVERGGGGRPALEHSEGFRDAIGRFLQTGDLDALPERVELPEVKWEVPGAE